MRGDRPLLAGAIRPGGRRRFAAYCSTPFNKTFEQG